MKFVNPTRVNLQPVFFGAAVVGRDPGSLRPMKSLRHAYSDALQLPVFMIDKLGIPLIGTRVCTYISIVE